MFKRKNNLDEMQKQMRNSIGNQMFIIMFGLLLVAVAAYGAGFIYSHLLIAYGSI